MAGRGGRSRRLSAPALGRRRILLSGRRKQPRGKRQKKVYALRTQAVLAAPLSRADFARQGQQWAATSNPEQETRVAIQEVRGRAPAWWALAPLLLHFM